MRISAASPIHSSNCNWRSKRSNQRPCPLASSPHARPGFVVSVRRRTVRLLLDDQASFPELTAFGIYVCNLLEARMIVTTYNQHVRLLSSEPFGWFAPPKSTRAWEPTLLWNHYTQNPRSETSVWRSSRRKSLRFLQKRPPALARILL